MKRMQFLLCAVLPLLGACTTDEGKQAGPLGGTAGVMAPVGATAGSGVSGAPGTAGGAPIGAAGSLAAGGGAAGLAGLAGMGAPTAGGAGRGTPTTPGAGTGAAAAGAPSAGAPAAGMGAAAAGSGAAGGGGTTAGSVTVQFTTVSYRGEYAPLNYGAVWFERGTGEFVKTAKRWAGAAHASDLVAWTMASGGWGSLLLGGGNREDMMDAVSSATIRTHQMHMVTWNMLDAQKQVVPDGEYVAVLEMSESRSRDRAGPLLRVKFTKGAAPQTVEVPDESSFTGVVLRYTP